MTSRLLMVVLLASALGCSEEQSPGAPGGVGGGTSPRPDAGGTADSGTPPGDGGPEADAGDEDGGTDGSDPDVFEVDGLQLTVLGAPPDQVLVAKLEAPSSGPGTVPRIGTVGLPEGAERPDYLSSTGRIVYNAERLVLREMRCDGCDGWRPGNPYPQRPELNDPDVTFTKCSSVITHHPGPERDLAVCDNLFGTWYDARGQTVYMQQRRLRHVGRGALAMTYDNADNLSGMVIVDLEADAEALVDEPWGEARAIRAVDGGFLVAGELANDLGLWFVGKDGSVQLRGTYPQLPDGVSASGVSGLALMGDGTLYRFAQQAPVSEQVIVRMDTDGLSEVAFVDQGTFIKDGLPHLLTGP